MYKTLFFKFLVQKHEGRLKRFKSHQERTVTMECFRYDNSQSLLMKLEKLIQISVKISVKVRPIKKLEVNDKSKILVSLRTFGTTIVI